MIDPVGNSLIHLAHTQVRQHAQESFKLADGNKDNKISFKEFTEVSQKSPEEAQKIFSDIDINQDGSIDAAEAQTHAKATMQDLMAEMSSFTTQSLQSAAFNIFESLDRNKDGKLNINESQQSDRDDDSENRDNTNSVSAGHQNYRHSRASLEYVKATFDHEALLSHLTQPA